MNFEELLQYIDIEKILKKIDFKGINKKAQDAFSDDAVIGAIFLVLALKLFSQSNMSKKINLRKILRK